MNWRAVVAALDDYEVFRSRVSVYQHPLAGRPVLWHVIRALLAVSPPPREIHVVHREDAPVILPDAPDIVVPHAVREKDQRVALRAAATRPGLTLLVDGAAPLVTPGTLQRLLHAGEQGVCHLAADGTPAAGVAVAGEGPAVASAEDPRMPDGAMQVASSTPLELLRVTDRHSLGVAGVALRDRLVRQHEKNGVTFILPSTVWIDVDVRIGPDTVIYPGVVLEGSTDIGSECVIGPYSRVVESIVGRGAELTGWNYLSRTTLRNHAVLEPYVRRGTL